MSDQERKRLAFCCYRGQERSVFCAETAAIFSVNATWIAGGWSALLKNNHEAERQRLLRDHANDHIIFIEDDIYPHDLKLLQELLNSTSISYEFLRKAAAIDVAKGELSPTY